MSAVTPAIVIDGLIKWYGEREILSGVSLTVAAGELVALLGPNGAGKTTTIEIVEGYRTADGGRVEVLGRDPVTAGAGLRARVGIMLQEGGVDPQARPLELLRLYRRLHRHGRDPDGLLDLVGLRDVAETPYRRLSGGEQQRLALALALVGLPDVLVLDEPTAGMDPEGKRATRELIGAMRDAGLAILMTTHDLADVERLADRVAILHDGRIVVDGSVQELTRAGAIAFEIRVYLEPELNEAVRGSLGAALGPEAALVPDPGHPGPGRYIVVGTAADPVAVATIANWAVAHDVRILELRVASATLEDRYFALTADVADGRDGAGGEDRDGTHSAGPQ